MSLAAQHCHGERMPLRRLASRFGHVIGYIRNDIDTREHEEHIRITGTAATGGTAIYGREATARITPHRYRY